MFAFAGIVAAEPAVPDGFGKLRGAHAPSELARACHPQRVRPRRLRLVVARDLEHVVTTAADRDRRDVLGIRPGKIEAGDRQVDRRDVLQRARLQLPAEVGEADAVVGDRRILQRHADGAGARELRNGRRRESVRS